MTTANKTDPTEKLIYIAVFVILLAGAIAVYVVRSRKPAPPSWQQRDATIAELDAKLKALTAAIKSQAGSSKCDDDSQCRLQGLGVKSCGGYNNWLIYSTADVNEEELLATVRRFNETFEQFVNLSLQVPSCGKQAQRVRCVDKGCVPTSH